MYLVATAAALELAALAVRLAFLVCNKTKSVLHLACHTQADITFLVVVTVLTGTSSSATLRHWSASTTNNPVAVCYRPCQQHRHHRSYPPTPQHLVAEKMPWRHTPKPHQIEPSQLYRPLQHPTTLGLSVGSTLASSSAISDPISNASLHCRHSIRTVD